MGHILYAPTSKIVEFKMETVVIQLTCKCPLNCDQCYMVKSNAEMDIETAKAAIYKAGILGARTVQLTGGEPLTYDKLDELIAYCHENGMFSAVATSGYSHSRERYSAMFKSGLTALCISLNSVKKDENLVTRDGFELSMGAIHDMVELGEQFCVNIVVSKHNIDTLYGTVKTLVDMGCRDICLLKRFPDFRGQRVEKLTRSDILKLCRVTDDFSSIVDVEGCFWEYWFFVKRQIYSCRDAGKSSYFVNVNGEISPCSQMFKCSYPDLLSMNNDADAWRRGYCYAENN